MVIFMQRDPSTSTSSAVKEPSVSFGSCLLHESKASPENDQSSRPVS